MSASIGEMELMSTAPLRAKVPPTPTATPTRAISRGSPAAIRVPSMTMSTSAAMAMPRISEMPNSSETSSVISLLARAVTPAEETSWAMSWTCWRTAGASPLIEVLNWTWAIAAVPSSDTNRMPCEASSWRLARASLAAPASSSLVPASSFCLARGEGSLLLAELGVDGLGGHAGRGHLLLGGGQLGLAGGQLGRPTHPAAPCPADACCSPAARSVTALSSWAWVANGSTVP